MKLSLGITPRDYSAAGGITYDTDALAYFTANTAITSAADKNEINTFYLGLKSDGIYTKMKAMYLPIWGSAATSKWNLKNPLDTDAAFRLTFSTGWSYSSGGITPTNAFANTFLISSTSGLVQNSTHISYYSRTDNNPSSDVCMGAQFLTGDAGLTQMTIRNSTNNFFCRINDNTTPVNVSNTNGTGFYIASRTSSTTIATFRNTTKTSVSQTSSGLPVRVMEIGRILINGASFYGAKQCAFSSIGDGLTDAEASNFYTRVNTLMTYFGINV